MKLELHRAEFSSAGTCGGSAAPGFVAVLVPLRAWACNVSELACCSELLSS